MDSAIAGKRIRWGSLVAALLIAVLAYYLSESFLFVFSLKENALEFTTVIGLLGPALIASLFVERAVQVVVTTLPTDSFEAIAAVHKDRRVNQANPLSFFTSASL